MAIRVAILSIVPSPYQRDMFHALSQCPDIELQVFYNEAGSPDSPWAKRPLQAYEQILPGFYMSWGKARFIVNLKLPEVGNCDVVIFNGFMTLAAQRLLRFGLAAKKLFWAERMVGPSRGLKGLLHRFLASPLKYLDGIVGIGSGAVADYKRRFPEMPVYNIPYHTDLTDFAAAQENLRPRQPPVILFCGQMIGRKGVDILLKGFEAVLKTGRKARLLLVGREADLPRFIDLLEEETRKHIAYAGFQQPERLPGFFAQADIFVLPSRYDGWGVVVNQALGAGLPVIVSDKVGAQDLVKEGQNGYIFKNEDPGSLKASLIRLIDDPEGLNRMGEVSALMARDISPAHGAARWCEVLASTMGLVVTAKSADKEAPCAS